jgi:hypothetical protein
MRKWKLVSRGGKGSFGYEVYQNTKEPERYLAKIYVYDKPILLSGDKEILGNKINELSQVLNELQRIFPTYEIPF